MEEIFYNYTSVSAQPDQGLDGTRFLKFCRDSALFDQFFRLEDVDIVFAKTKEAGKRHMTYKGFVNALEVISKKKRLSVEELSHFVYLNAPRAPSYSVTTVADQVPLHDNIDEYTGVYKAGGPTMVDANHVGLNQLVDRTLARNALHVPASSAGSINVSTNAVTPAGTSQISAPSATSSSLRSVYDSYCIKSNGSSSLGMEGSKFRKFCKDSEVFCSSFRPEDVDVLFVKFRDIDGRFLSFEKFEAAVADIARRRNVDSPALNQRILKKLGSTINTPLGVYSSAVTVPLPTPLHDDMNTYTGVYKTGGPTVVDKAHLGLDRLVSRGIVPVARTESNRSLNTSNANRTPSSAPDISNLRITEDGTYSIPPGVQPAFTSDADRSLLAQQEHFNQQYQHYFKQQPPKSFQQQFRQQHEQLKQLHEEQQLQQQPQQRQQQLDTVHTAISQQPARLPPPPPSLPSSSPGQPAEYQSWPPGQQTASPLSPSEVDRRYNALLAQQTLGFDNNSSLPPPAPTSQAASNASMRPAAARTGFLPASARLRKLFNEFSGKSAGGGAGMDAARFLKFCKETSLFDSNFKKEAVDILFAKYRDPTLRVLVFDGFSAALADIARRRGLTEQEQLQNILDRFDSDRPVSSVFTSNSSTVPLPTPLHDDSSTYTGVYKTGGPTMVDKSHLGLDNLISRTPGALNR